MRRLTLKRWLFFIRKAVFTSMLPVILLLTLSCNPQKRLAKETVLNYKTPVVILLFPEFIFKKNSNSQNINGFKDMSQDQQDSALYYNSKFIQYVNDSVFLSVYSKSLKEELKEFGFRVYQEKDLDTFLTMKEPAYVFSIAQLEVEEDIEPVTETDVFDDTVTYYKKFDLALVKVNTWFELSRLNAEDGKPTVLFSTFFVEDQLKGHFWRHPLMLDVSYNYKLKEIRLEDVFGLADFSGRKNASYLFDYLFNNYYQGIATDSISKKRYWHYNRFEKNLRDAEDNRFILLDGK